MFADGAGTATKMVPTDDGRHILIAAIYGDCVEVFNKGKAKTHLPHRSMDHANRLATRLQFTIWGDHN